MDVLLIALAVSVDGLLAGVAVGLRGVRMRGRSYGIVAVVTFICVFLTMMCVAWLFASVAPKPAGWLGCFAMVAVALLTFFHKEEDSPDCARDCGILESFMLGLAVATDASIAAASLALTGGNPILVALLMAAAHAVLIGLGNFLGCRGIRLRGRAMQIIPALMLLVIAVLRMPVFG